MAHLQINYDSGYGNVHVPDQLFMFSRMIFCADLVGYPASIENYAPAQIMTFRGLEYTADSHSELILSGWIPYWVEGLSDIRVSTLKPISSEDIGPGSLAPPEEPNITTPGDLASAPWPGSSLAPISENTSYLEPTLVPDLELTSDPRHAEDMPGYTPGIL